MGTFRQAAIYFLNTAVALAIVGAAIWYIPYWGPVAGIFVAVIVAALYLPKFFLRWFPRSQVRAKEWEQACISVGRFVVIVVPIIIGAAALAALWAWYPFQSIGDVPLAQLTLNKIISAIVGFLLVITSVSVMFSGFQIRLDKFDYFLPGDLSFWLLWP